MPKPEGFILYKGFYGALKYLPTEDKAELFDAIFQYQIDGSIPAETSRIFVVFKMLQNQFELDSKKYNAFVERQKEKGRKSAEKRWGKKVTVVTPVIEEVTEANQAQPDVTYKEKDKVKDKDKESVSETPSEKPSKPTFKTLQSFISQKDYVLGRAKELYPEKDVEKAFNNFVSKNMAKKYGYTNFYQAFCNWVRDDRYNEYSKRPGVNDSMAVQAEEGKYSQLTYQNADNL